MTRDADAGDDATDDRDASTAPRGDATAPRGDATERTPGRGATPDARRITASAPDDFGLVQVWWGDGKGKTTAAMGMGFRAAGHGYRVHMLQFMKGGASSVEDVRGEYNAIERMPGFTYENSGHYGWHGRLDESDEDEHVAKARGGLERARELLAAADDAALREPLPLDGPADDGVHVLVLDEILYAANRGLVGADAVVDLVETKPDALELVLTGGHERPDYACERADLVTNVRKETHPIDAGQRARKGTEY
ncbi:MAG: cob(I)yrinic acid a,c-diamide adenosyltransferase [Halobacterium sp.]